jgi:tetratricopeptide (TPR) repeat protein
MHNLANVFSEVGRNLESLSLFEETITRRKKILGEDHPDTLKSMSDLSIVYISLGRQSDSVKLDEAILALRMKKLGNDHPDTLASMNNLAIGYSSIGQYEESLKLNQKTLVLRTKTLGDDHLASLQSMGNIASDYYFLFRHEEALALRKEVLTKMEKTLGRCHPESLKSRFCVIDSLMALNQLDEALLDIDELVERATESKRNGMEVDLELIDLAFAHRCAIIRNLQDATAMRQTAEMFEALQRTDVGSFYNAACFRSVTAQLMSNHPEEAKIEADQAMAWLKKAVEAGWIDHVHIGNDTDLDAIRDREDFQALLTELKAKYPATEQAVTKQ